MGVIRRPCDCCGSPIVGDNDCSTCCAENTTPTQVTLTLPSGWPANSSVTDPAAGDYILPQDTNTPKCNPGIRGFSTICEAYFDCLRSNQLRDDCDDGNQNAGIWMCAAIYSSFGTCYVGATIIRGPCGADPPDDCLCSTGPEDPCGADLDTTKYEVSIPGDESCLWDGLTLNKVSGPAGTPATITIKAS